MQFIFSTLKRQKHEETTQYDYRIQRMLPFVAGYVFFDLRNYNPGSGEFNVYIEWDKDLNCLLNDPLPSGGYFVKATLKQAYMLHEVGRGFPIYMKLVARNGRLYPCRQYLLLDGRPFSVEFNGAVLIPFEDRYEELGCKAAIYKDSGQASNGTAGQNFVMHGSQSYSLLGSQRYELLGSQSHSLFGSQRYVLKSSQWEYEFEYEWRKFLGSQRYGLLGSQSYSFFGSQRYGLHGSQSYSLFGSQRYGLHGSQSYSLGGNRQYGLNGSQQYNLDNGQQSQFVPPHWAYFPQEWQLIRKAPRPRANKGGNARFGYGLDLI